jgi:hypothetical protein
MGVFLGWRNAFWVLASKFSRTIDNPPEILHRVGDSLAHLLGGRLIPDIADPWPSTRPPASNQP